MSVQWTTKEVIALISIWGDEKHQEMLEATRKNIDTFEEIAKQLHETLPDRTVPLTAEKCRSKIKSLRSDYKKAREHNNTSGNGPSKFRFYDEMDEILGDRPATEPKALFDTSGINQEGYEDSNFDSGNDDDDDDRSDIEAVSELEHKKRRGSEEMPDCNQPTTKLRRIDENNFDASNKGPKTSQCESKPDDKKDVANKGARPIESQQSQPARKTNPTKPFIISKNKKKNDGVAEIMSVFLQMEERSMEKVHAMDKEMKEREKEDDRRFQTRMREMELEQERRRWEREDQRKKEEDQRRKEEDERRDQKQKVEDDRRNSQQMFQLQMANMFATLVRPAVSAMAIPPHRAPFQPEVCSYQTPFSQLPQQTGGSPATSGYFIHENSPSSSQLLCASSSAQENIPGTSQYDCDVSSPGASFTELN